MSSYGMTNTADGVSYSSLANSSSSSDLKHYQKLWLASKKIEGLIIQYIL